MEMALFEGRVVCISLTRTGPIIDTIESKFEQKMTKSSFKKKKLLGTPCRPMSNHSYFISYQRELLPSTE